MQPGVIYILFFCFLSSNVLAQSQPALKFDFGTGNSSGNYTVVRATDLYSEKKGYGFHQIEGLQEVNRGGDPVKADFITSTSPFYFSVALPEGNYDVKLMIGDTKGISETTVRAECRRLMVDHLVTHKGTIQTVSFSVHIKDSLIRNQPQSIDEKVRLKPREFAYLHWDNKLTLEFNDALPKIAAIEITPNHKAVTLFLAGNSTVVDQDKDPYAAWGQMFPVFLQPQKAVVANYAESGETLRAFKAEKRLQKIWSMAKPGDYLFIEFTHNDQKPGANHLDPFTTYQQTLTEWINEARSRNIIPVLVTSMHRRNFDSAGLIINTLGDYPEAMRQTAKANKVALIDLNAMSKQLYEALGVEGSLKAFVHFPEGSFPHQKEALKDNTHFSTYGAYLLASCVVKSIKDQQLPISAFLKKDIPSFNEQHPISFDQYYWPLSVAKSIVKPDGN